MGTTLEEVLNDIEELKEHIQYFANCRGKEIDMTTLLECIEKLKEVAIKIQGEYKMKIFKIQLLSPFPEKIIAVVIDNKVELDTHRIVNVKNGICTIPVTGAYEINNNYELKKAGEIVSIYKETPYYTWTSKGIYTIPFSGTWLVKGEEVKLKAGDKMDFEQGESISLVWKHD